MSDQLFDHAVRDWLDAGSDRTPPPAIDAVLLAIKTTPQERDLRIPRRFTLMPTYTRLAAGIAIVAVLGVGALLLSNPGPNVGPQTTPETTPGPTPSMTIGVNAPGTILYGMEAPAVGRTSLRAISAAGTDDRELVPDDGCCLVISPDGKWLLYGLGTDGPIVPNLHAVDGSESEKWTWPGPEVSGAVDSTTLNLAPAAATIFSSGWDFAFEGWDNGQPSRTGIYLDRDNGGALIGGLLTRVTSAPGTFHDVPLSFSPDGSRILFIRGGDNGQSVSGDLYVVARDGSGLVRLNSEGVASTISDEFGASASWSPDGTRVTFPGADPARTDGTQQIYVVASTGGLATAISEAGPSTTSARWSPDGSWIAFDRGTPAGPHEVFVVHPDGTGLTNLTTGLSVGVCCGQWSPDSRWLVVQGSLVNDDAKTDLFIVSAGGAPAARLTQSPSDYRWWVQWTSPIP